MMDLPSSSISQKLIRNTIFNSIGRVWTIFVGLLLTPYIISKLGIQRFGVWSLILAMTNCLGLLDLGMRYSFVKYVSEYYTKKDYRAINNVINMGLFFYLVLTIAAIILVSILGDFVLQSLQIPLRIQREARFVLQMTTATFFLSNMFGVFRAVIAGLQRMDITNMISIAASIANIISTVVFLELGCGLKGLAFSSAIVLMLTAPLLTIYSLRCLPQLRWDLRFLKMKTLQKLVKYGIKVQVSRLAELATLQIDKIALGYFGTPSLVAFYEVGSRAVHAGKSLILMGAIVPAAAELEAKKDLGSLQQLYLRASKYLVLVAAPLMLFIASSASLLIQLWLGTGYEKSVLVVQTLAIGHFIHLLTGVGTTIAKGIGKPEYEMRYALLLLLMNAVLAVILIAKLGFSGALIATPLSLIASSLYFMRAFHKLLCIPLIQFMREMYLKPMMGCVVAGLAVYNLVYLAGRFIPPWNRLTSLTALGLGGIVFLGIYLGIILKSGYLDSYDRKILSSIRRAILTV